MPRKKSAAQLDREVREALSRCPDCARPFDAASRRHAADPGVNRFLIPTCCTGDYRAANPAWKPTRPVHATKDEWSVVIEDGYVRVKRGGETIAAAVDTGGGRLTGIEFTRPEYQRSNPTRQKAMRVLQQEGYR